MGVFQKLQVVCCVEGLGLFVVAAHDDLQRHTAYAREGEHRIGYLPDAVLHLRHLLHAVGTGDVEQQQRREAYGFGEPVLAEGGREHEIWQMVHIPEVEPRDALLGNEARLQGHGGYPVCLFLDVFRAHAFYDGTEFCGDGSTEFSRSGLCLGNLHCLSFVIVIFCLQR